MAQHPEPASDCASGDPHYFVRTIAASAAKRDRIIEDVARDAGPHDDVDYLTQRELYRAGLISASELHATGSPELLPPGWYSFYVEAVGEHCPARVFSREEAGATPLISTNADTGGLPFSVEAQARAGTARFSTFAASPLLR